MTEITDDYALEDDGTVQFNFGGITRVLKRPTLRQYREIMQGLGDLRDQLLENGDTGVVKVQIDVMVKWFDDVFTSLAGEGLPKIGKHVDEDKLPSWLLSNDIVTDLVRHWQTVPSRPGRAR